MANVPIISFTPFFAVMRAPPAFARVNAYTESRMIDNQMKGLSLQSHGPEGFEHE